MIKKSVVGLTLLAASGLALAAAKVPMLPEFPKVFPSGRQVPTVEEMYPAFVLNEGDCARVQHVFAKAMRGKKITVAGIGGSITCGAFCEKTEWHWCNVVASWFRKNFPKVKVEFVNAGYSSGSDFAVYRVDKDVISHSPDVVGIDFAVNDRCSEYCQPYNEGLVRHLLTALPQSWIFQLAMAGGPKCHNGQKYHQPISAYYGIQHFSWADALRSRVDAGQVQHIDFSKDQLHPNQYGHAYAGLLVWKYLDAQFAAFKAAKCKPRAIPPMPKKPLFTTIFDHGSITMAKDVKLAENHGFECKEPPKKLLFYYKNMLEAVEVGSSMTLETTARNLALMVWCDPDEMGRASVTVDGRPMADLEGWCDYKTGLARFMPIYQDLPAGVHRVRFEVKKDRHPKSKGNRFRVLSVLETK